MTPGPLAVKTPSLVSPHEDLSWSVYPIETIIAEKLHALIAHGDINSRSKDVHDLATFLPKADAEILGTALKRCFSHRSSELPDNLSATLRSIDTKSLERGWISATASIPDKAEFRTVFDALVRSISEMEGSFSE